MKLVFQNSDRLIVSVSIDIPTDLWYTSSPEIFTVIDIAEVPAMQGPSRYTELGEIELISNYSPI